MASAVQDLEPCRARRRPIEGLEPSGAASAPGQSRSAAAPQRREPIANQDEQGAVSWVCRGEAFAVSPGPGVYVVVAHNALTVASPLGPPRTWGGETAPVSVEAGCRTAGRSGGAEN